MQLASGSHARQPGYRPSRTNCLFMAIYTVILSERDRQYAWVNCAHRSRTADNSLHLKCQQSRLSNERKLNWVNDCTKRNNYPSRTGVPIIILLLVSLQALISVVEIPKFLHSFISCRTL